MVGHSGSNVGKTRDEKIHREEGNPDVSIFLFFFSGFTWSKSEGGGAGHDPWSSGRGKNKNRGVEAKKEGKEFSLFVQ